MSKEMIDYNIARLIMLRRIASTQEQKIINLQLSKLYEFKYELLKGEDYV